MSHDLPSKIVLAILFLIGLFAALTMGHGFYYVGGVTEVAQRLWERLRRRRTRAADAHAPPTHTRRRRTRHE
ncbi:MAG: hypothetical protein KY445_10455 [Armatimonadetes bacterium]|nr:hypothetical protein [Armatimonadota bacterium]